jgi:YD repeat-containing protein
VSLNCSSTTGTLAGGVIANISCDTGALTTNCADGGAAANGVPLPYPGCYEPGETTIGPLVFVACGKNDDDPPACKVDAKSSDLRRSSAGLVGDPVDLRTGALSLDPVDVDLGNGLRFARHYSSKTTVQSAMGKSWAHSLDWKLFRTTAQTYPVVIVKEPLRPAVGFASNGVDGYVTSPSNAGSVTVDGSGAVHYTSDTGVEADFDALNQLVALRHPGEPEIAVSYGTDTTTFTNGSQTLVVSLYPTGHASAGLVASVAANGEIWSYAYNSGKALTSVIGPDPSTPSVSDTITWTYVYTAGVSNRITRIDRTSGAGTTTLASWTFGSGNRVVAADEPALEQALQLAYSTPQTGVLRTTVSNASGQTLALFDSDTSVTKGILTSVTNPSGPMAPLPGGPGVPVPYTSVTTTGTPSRRIETKTDRNGNVTLYEDYDDHGRPGRIVEGWVDGVAEPGVFSPDDTFARLREYTYHPVLDDPLTITEDSAIPGAPDRVTIFDYDDPLAPGDNPAVPNEDPTSRLHARIEAGSTLDASGATVAVSATTRFTYDGAGHVLTESGPRTENHTQHLYDTAGNRTATRRYLAGPASSYLETTFASFDARGNPQTATDPNGRITTFTYDAAGRVKTVTPPYTGEAPPSPRPTTSTATSCASTFRTTRSASPTSCAWATTRRTASRSWPIPRGAPSSTSEPPGA